LLRQFASTINFQKTRQTALWHIPLSSMAIQKCATAKATVSMPLKFKTLGVRNGKMKIVMAGSMPTKSYEEPGSKMEALRGYVKAECILSKEKACLWQARKLGDFAAIQVYSKVSFLLPTEDLLAQPLFRSIPFRK